MNRDSNKIYFKKAGFTQIQILSEERNKRQKELVIRLENKYKMLQHTEDKNAKIKINYPGLALFFHYLWLLMSTLSNFLFTYLLLFSFFE